VRYGARRQRLVVADPAQLHQNPPEVGFDREFLAWKSSLLRNLFKRVVLF
jgi:hypothetical protein